jgi:hypothetical protein
MSEDIADRLRNAYLCDDCFGELTETLVEAAKEIERLRLTDREREAIKGLIAEEYRRGAYFWADTLRKMLERVQ